MAGHNTACPRLNMRKTLEFASGAGGSGILASWEAAGGTISGEARQDHRAFGETGWIKW